MLRQWRTVVSIGLALTLGVSMATGEKGGKPKPQSDLYVAGSIEFQDHGDDSIVSDGGGAYVDGVGGVEFIHDVDGLHTEGHLGSRQFTIHLGAPVSETSHDPTHGQGSMTVFGEIDAVLYRSIDGELVPPNPGETNNVDGVVVVFQSESDNGYFLWRGSDGGVTVTAYDDDSDDVADRVSLNATSAAVVDLYSQVTYTVRRGKRSRTCKRYDWAGTFTNMPFQMTFRPQGYARTHPPHVFYESGCGPWE